MSSKHYHIKLNFDSDREVIDRIESKENKNDYIRRLVLSDIAADYLQGMIKLEKDKYIDTDMIYQARVDFYNDHCPALNKLDQTINYCDDCVYRVHYTDVDGIEKAACNLEEAWIQYCQTTDKTHLNSLYGKMVRDPFMDDVIDNMLEAKNDGEMG